MEIEEEREEKQTQRTERLMELLEGEMEGKDVPIIEHRSHDHPLVLRESLQDSGYGGEGVQVYCDGCQEPISSSSYSSSSGSRGGGGAFYACPNSDCWFLLHKRCANLPPEIEHHSDPNHALTITHFPLHYRVCDVCDSTANGFLYRCSGCHVNVHVRCASMALHIRDRVDENNKIHKHPLIPIEKEVQFFCDVCGREHKGKSYLCSTCGFWANQICASVPTTIDLHSHHPHPLTLCRPSRHGYRQSCEICNKEVKRAHWAYCCSEKCEYRVHVDCWLSLEEAQNSNKDIQTNLQLESTSHKIDILRDPKEEITRIIWPMCDESIPIMTQLIKNLNLGETHESATKILHCREDHQLKFVEKIEKSKDDQVCDGCGQTISSQFFHCAQCNFSLHEWCAELPNELQHISHPEHQLRLITQGGNYIRCQPCGMYTNRFFYSCFTCWFKIDLKCASLPRVIKHQGHDHKLILSQIKESDSCNACGRHYHIFALNFKCKGCNFGVCINCALLPISVKHRYDKHPFALTYSAIEGQPDEYYCEICEKDIDLMFWFYHCIKCDQSLHLRCIYPRAQCMNLKFGERIKVNFHSHLVRCVQYPKAGVGVLCNLASCRDSREVHSEAFECEQCDFWVHAVCLILNKP